ncbi:di-heme-cytochrome C peroxidase [Gilvimarinus sp. SDUM040013]|uniref:Di-heme-cytochrome C peroxidase n=1 Tax=Gilvimarinus gilvus TaxID=3058038 RepID=A0ABU4RUL6_9GAMM|nr:di-heme-cytochrome C peroxidase [Gilvimarinus sp. SDUM040013]MDO3388297.1 di-heme-cytochrome C peroxidase [Gilvimarinus sp. SDUM040013]MDX6847847.1 di-heme-cytochrome C peroxidase [Gilvimarinus sp. SDUM040013]
MVVRKYLTAVCMLTLVACQSSDDHLNNPSSETTVNGNDRDYIQTLFYAEQNWSEADRLWFYNTSQGSNLIPLEFFLHLETAHNTELFRAARNMGRYRYLPQNVSQQNPYGLPLGWVANTHEGETYVGLTCAACHTAQVNWQGRSIRIDGGPAMADMDKMLGELEQAIAATLTQTDKWQRFSTALAAIPQAKLRAQVELVYRELAAYNARNRSINKGTEVAYGYARLDAFGRIYNRILSHLTPNANNANSPNAPVSYPFLWDTPQHDFVQWNGVGDNSGHGALGRNTGEVLGVFASFNLRTHNQAAGYPSSIDVANLIALEKHLEKLWSPSWESLAQRELLPPINRELAAAGQTLFHQYQCHTCHQPIQRQNPQRRILAQMSSMQRIGTDPQMAENAFNYSGLSGYFEGQYIDDAAPENGQFKAVAQGLLALRKASSGAIRYALAGQSSRENSAADAGKVQNSTKYLDLTTTNKASPRALLAYKARPLNGIWATAPYLHNGSVPTLYDLLLPACDRPSPHLQCRPNRFSVGSFELDTTLVGFIKHEATTSQELFIFNTQLPGNSNRGHEYAAGVTPVIVTTNSGEIKYTDEGEMLTRTLPALDHEQRLALVEYLKTL